MWVVCVFVCVCVYRGLERTCLKASPTSEGLALMLLYT